MTQLDAKGCSNLQYIDCSECLLSNLDVALCAALVSVDCSYNSLLKLDIPDGLANLNEIKCISQSLSNWLSATKLDFIKFLESPDGTAEPSVYASSLPAQVSNLTAYDENDEVINYTEDGGVVTFASAPDRMTYDYDTGFNNTLMDVEIFAADRRDDNNDDGRLGPSGGGCNSGFGALAALVIWLLKRK